MATKIWCDYWSIIDASVDRLRAEGWSDRRIADELRIPQKTLADRLHKRQPVHEPVRAVDTSVENSADEVSGRSRPSAPGQTVVQRFERLEGKVQALARAVRSIMERMDPIPGQTPVQITGTPPYPKGKEVPWNLWILEPIRDDIASIAAERNLPPSQLVQEVLWKFLSERSASSPSRRNEGETYG
jgi:hypothetical protein